MIEPRYQDDQVTLYCGDCLEILPQLEAGSIDAVVTDPPYGKDYDSVFKKWDGRKSNYKKIIGDNKKFDPAPFLGYSTVILFGANYYSDVLPIGGWIIWDKRTNETLDKMIGNPVEMAWKNNPGLAIIRVLHGGVVNADSVNGNNEPRFHPTQKPIKLFSRILTRFTDKNQSIFDPFMGSGTTGLAAVQLGRRFIGIEIDEKYYQIAEKRIREAQLQMRLPFD